MSINFLEIFVGIVVGWIFTRISQFFTKATLKFEIDNGRIFTINQSRYRFLSVKVSNSSNGIFARTKRLLLGGVDIEKARAWVEFINSNNNSSLLKINARWATTKEPIADGGKIDWPQIMLPSREDIPLEENSIVNVAVKKDEDQSFYGFNNESYPHLFINPDFELNQRACMVKITILSHGKWYHYQCNLVNVNKKLSGFRLQQL